MIRNVHVEALREQVAQAERDLAGWRYLLGQAEQGERAGTVLPDPLAAPPRHGWGLPEVMPDPHMPAGAPWPAPPIAPVHGRDPYPAAGGPSVFDGKLPPDKEQALSVVASEHDAYAQSRDGVKEEQKWGSA